MVNPRRQCGNSDAKINTSRRIYRGRSGPRDGNLPPPRRRRGGRTTKEQVDDGIDEENRPRENTAVNSTEGAVNTFYDSDEEERGDLIIIPNNENKDNSTNDHQKQQNNDIAVDDTDTAALDKELQHLQKRIKHVRESIQQSNSLHNPKFWEENCLNPVRNAILEWRSIIKHYGCLTAHDDGSNEEYIFDKSNTKSIKMALEVYQILQMSMQCGPLVGSKPAYFRRCGVHVVKMAYSFLCDALIPDDMMDLLEKKDFSLDVLMAPLQLSEERKDVVTEDKRDEDDSFDNEDSGSETEDDEGEENYKIILKLEEEHVSDDSSYEIINGNQSGDDEDDGNEVSHPELKGQYTPQQTTLTKSFSTELRFTERQANTIQSWLKDAQKAISKNRTPSKSALKLQEKGGSKKKLKKKHDTEKRRRGKGRKKK